MCLNTYVCVFLRNKDILLFNHMPVKLRNLNKDVISPSDRKQPIFGLCQMSQQCPLVATFCLDTNPSPGSHIQHVITSPDSALTRIVPPFYALRMFFFTLTCWRMQSNDYISYSSVQCVIEPLKL